MGGELSEKYVGRMEEEQSHLEDPVEGPDVGVIGNGHIPWLSTSSGFGHEEVLEVVPFCSQIHPLVESLPTRKVASGTKWLNTTSMPNQTVWK